MLSLYFGVLGHLGCTSSESGASFEQVIFTGKGDWWQREESYLMTVAVHYAHVTLIDLNNGKVKARCSLGPDLLDIQLSPDAKRVAWLDRKSLHVLQLSDCSMLSYAWTQLWPKAPPAPVRIQWSDSQNIVSYSTPSLKVPIQDPLNTQPFDGGRTRPVSAMVFNEEETWCGDVDGVVFDCTTGTSLWKLPERVADLEAHQGLLCGVSTGQVRCGDNIWATDALKWRYPQFYTTDDMLWVQDRVGIKQEAGARWYRIDLDEGPQEEQSPSELSWPSETGWIHIQDGVILNDEQKTFISQPLEFQWRQNQVIWKEKEHFYLLDDDVSKIQKPVGCIDMTWFLSRSVCVGTNTLKDIDSSEILYEGKDILMYAANDAGALLVHSAGEITKIDASGMTTSSISLRHRISAVGLSSDLTDMALGSHTGSVLIWDNDASSWRERVAYPNDVVSLSWSHSNVLVALSDEPFAILSEHGEQRGRRAATTMAGNGPVNVVAYRYGGIQILSTGKECTQAVGVHQIEWLSDRVLVWAGETSGIWDIYDECRSLGVKKGRLEWLDSKQPILNRAELGG